MDERDKEAAEATERKHDPGAGTFWRLDLKGGGHADGTWELTPIGFGHRVFVSAEYGDIVPLTSVIRAHRGSR